MLLYSGLRLVAFYYNQQSDSSDPGGEYLNRSHCCSRDLLLKLVSAPKIFGIYPGGFRFTAILNGRVRLVSHSSNEWLVKLFRWHQRNLLLIISDSVWEPDRWMWISWLPLVYLYVLIFKHGYVSLRVLDTNSKFLWQFRFVHVLLFDDLYDSLMVARFLQQMLRCGKEKNIMVHNCHISDVNVLEIRQGFTKV